VVEYAATLVVEDADGARLQLYEFRGWRLFRRVRSYVLDTGEPVSRIDFDNYVVIASGETLKRVK
jgi:hypothetical protein